MTDLIEKARVFALAAHSAVSQKRKYTGLPYITHPAEVAATVAEWTNWQPEMVAAAYLHDVIEDTGVSIEIIREEFGQCVADLVDGLTDVSRPEDGNRAHRKAIDLAHSAAQSEACQTIKLADLISNTISIARLDKEFSKIYLPEKLALLEDLTRAIPIAQREARQVLACAYRTIGLLPRG